MLRQKWQALCSYYLLFLFAIFSPARAQNEDKGRSKRERKRDCRTIAAKMRETTGRTKPTRNKRKKKNTHKKTTTKMEKGTK